MYDLSLWGSARGTPRKLKEPLKKSGVSSLTSDCEHARRSAREIAGYCEDSQHPMRTIWPQDAASRLFQRFLSHYPVDPAANALCGALTTWP